MLGKKTAATLASTGTPAFFVHPSEASHGDLGMITPQDVVIAFSWSGETAELASLISYSRRFSVPLIAITSRADSTLAKASESRVGPFPISKKPARTVSPQPPRQRSNSFWETVWPSHCWKAKDLPLAISGSFHPGGSLGAQLKFVSDIMHEQDELPLVSHTMPMSEALVVMTEKEFWLSGNY